MKNLLKKLLHSIGLELKRINKKSPVNIQERPVGDMRCLLEDLKSRELNCSWIMDIGANRTDWSRLAKSIYPDADFCLIEPQAEMKKCLEDFCNEFKNSIFVLAGAGAKFEIKTFTVWNELFGSSFLPDLNYDLKHTGKEQRQIKVVTIDNIIADYQIKIPELIKLDIQGFELEALKGASSTFGFTEVYILEVSFFPFEHSMPVFSEVINFMLDKNYVVYDFPGFLRRPSDGALGQCDICFVKKNGFLRKSNEW